MSTLRLIKLNRNPGSLIKIGLVIGLLAVLMGCAGTWFEGYYVETLPGPDDMFLFGGDYYRGRDAHDYSHRGFESRRAAHHHSGGQRGRR